MKCEEMKGDEQLTSLDVERQRRIQSSRKNVFDARPDLDLENLDPKSQILERESKHLRKRMILHLSLVSKLGEEMERESLLNSTSSTSSLSSVTLRDPGFDQLGDLPLLVEPVRMR